MSRWIASAEVLAASGVLLAWGALWRITPGNLVALAGAFVPTLAMLAVMCYYEAAIAQRTYQEDMEQMLRAAEARDRLFRRPLVVATLLLPGFWIGLAARSPLPIAVAYWVTTGLSGWINHTASPPIPERQVTHRRGDLTGLLVGEILRSLALVLASAATGIALRSWLRL